MKCDGHIHSPYCPHGTSDSFKQYIEKQFLTTLLTSPLLNMHHYH